MKRRRTSEDADSMEMLLDPICDMFGGIFFTAVLVVILTSAAAVRVRNDNPSKAAAVSASIDATVISARIADYEQGLAELSKNESVVATTQAVQDAADLQQLERDRAETQRQIEDAKRWIEELKRVETQAKDVDKQIAEAEETVESLEAELKKQTSSKTIEARLPIERQTTATQVLFLIKNGRMYWVPLGRASGLLDESFANDVMIHQRSVLLNTIYEAIPTPNGGFAIEGDLEANARMRAILERMQPQTHFFDFYVAPDSVAEFREMRSLAVKRGYRYNVKPIPGDRPLQLITTSTVNVQ